MMDVRAGIDYIKSKPMYENKPIIIFGTSIGGSVAINSIGNYDDIDGVISLSAYSSLGGVVEDHFILNGAPRWLGRLENKLFNKK